MIRNIFAFELYDMNHGFDMKVVLKTTVERILQADIALIICTDFRSLYECFVKLRTTYEERLMIDVINFRQSYEKREITKVR